MFDSRSLHISLCRSNVSESLYTRSPWKLNREIQSDLHVHTLELRTNHIVKWYPSLLHNTSVELTHTRWGWCHRRRRFCRCMNWITRGWIHSWKIGVTSRSLVVYGVVPEKSRTICWDVIPTSSHLYRRKILRLGPCFVYLCSSVGVRVLVTFECAFERWCSSDFLVL